MPSPQLARKSALSTCAFRRVRHQKRRLKAKWRLRGNPPTTTTRPCAWTRPACPLIRARAQVRAPRSRRGPLPLPPLIRARARTHAFMAPMSEARPSLQAEPRLASTSSRTMPRPTTSSQALRRLTTPLRSLRASKPPYPTASLLRLQPGRLPMNPRFRPLQPTTLRTLLPPLRRPMTPRLRMILRTPHPPARPLLRLLQPTNAPKQTALSSIL